MKRLVALSFLEFEKTYVGVYAVRTVVLIIALAILAVVTGTNLGTDSDAVTDFDTFHLGADFNCCSHNFVAADMKLRQSRLVLR